MKLLLPLAALLLGAASQRAVPGSPRATPAPTPVASTPAATADPGLTRCGACHSTATWSDVGFNHAKVGFPLTGAHASVTCRDCHATGFAQTLSTQCSGCHRDTHRGELGERCQNCHEDSDWKSAAQTYAHRNGNFPLVGAHGALPCEECHQPQRDHSFSRAALDCKDCHYPDYLRAAASGVDHVAAGFSLNCRECHLPNRFLPARYVAHDHCFQISGGPHATLTCTNCHTSLAGKQANGTCMTNTAACTECHTHSCDQTATLHKNVPGYQCRDRKCYECHNFSSGAK